MKSILILFFIASSFVIAGDREDLTELYKTGEYKKACILGGKILYENRFDESLVQAYGFSCLEVDYIDMVSNVPRFLKRTPKSRMNASYFATIIAQKKLLYQAVVDDYDITGLVFPKTDHIISKVFRKFVRKDYRRESDKYIFDFAGGSVVKMEKTLDGDLYKLIINEYQDGSVVKKHLYW